MRASISLCGALLVAGACDDKDRFEIREGAREPAQVQEGPVLDAGVPAGAVAASDGGAPSTGVATAADAGDSQPRKPVMVVDAQVLLSRDAGSQNTSFLPPDASSDASFARTESPAVGRAFAESEFVIQEPAALAKVLGSAARTTSEVKLLVVAPFNDDAGTALRYGPADLVDGGLIWQKPPAHPRSFGLASTEQEGRTFVSVPFKYVLEARVPANAEGVYRVYLEAEQAIFRATYNASYDEISSGELRGVLTREQLDHRPLDVASCLVACGQNGGVCTQNGSPVLAVTFDCNGQKPDTDTNGDGVLDGYRLLLGFKSRQVTPPTE
jgi:hypothetical protein